MLHRDTPAEQIEQIVEMERRADRCIDHLRLNALPTEQAVWVLLTAVISQIESNYLRFGPDTAAFRAAMINLARYAPMIVRALANPLPEQVNATLQQLWDPSLGMLANADINTMAHYDAFQNNYPMWFRNRTHAEIREGDIVRFTVDGSGRYREVSAYQKGLRPLNGRFQAAPSQRVEPTEAILRRYRRLLTEATVTSDYGFSYEHSYELARRTYNKYAQRLEGMMRRSDSVSLGPYTLEVFKRFYAGVQALSSIHEYMCFCWTRWGHRYPLASALMVKSRREWIQLLKGLSGLDSDVTDRVLTDLSFYPKRLPDLHVYPFVPLDSQNSTLALIPHFILNSAPEENILRTCSALRPHVYDLLSNEKEATMREYVLGKLTRFNTKHSIPLPDGSTEIDLVVEDLSSSTVLIAELKWYRKPNGYRARLQADEQFLDGFHRQVRTVREFCRENPDFLRQRGVLTRSLNTYDNVYFGLLARDHWVWIDPVENSFVLDVEQLLDILETHETLHAAMSESIRYEWLPREGRDFYVRFERAMVEDVPIETEVYYGGPEPSA